jgi:hypothetical protein
LGDDEIPKAAQTDGLYKLTRGNYSWATKELSQSKQNALEQKRAAVQKSEAERKKLGPTGGVTINQRA